MASSSACKFLLVLLCVGAAAAARPAQAACGNVNGDAVFDAADLDDLLDHLVDPGAGLLGLGGMAQCTVVGRARACDVANAVVMQRNLDPTGLGPPIGDGCEDGDQDGVADSLDLCPQTPRGVAPLDTVPGCSSLDMALRPDGLTSPAANGLSLGHQLLSAPEFPTHPLIVDLRDATSLAMAEMALAADDVLDGSFCSAASQYGDALDAVELERADLQAGYTGLRLDLETEGPLPPNEHFGDGQLAVVALDVALVELDRGLAAAQIAAEGFDASCADVTGTLAVTGVVREIDDALGVMTLVDGTAIALPEGSVAEPIGPGGTVDVFGTELEANLGASIGVAANVTCQDCVEANPGLAEPACLFLRIAPVQGFAPFDLSTTEKHHPLAYQGSQAVLELERGMALTVVQGWCEGSQSLIAKPRYSMRIEIAGDEIARDLTPGASPLVIPNRIPVDLPRVMLLQVRRQLCPTPGNCGPFTDYADPTSWIVRVHERGSLCSAAHATSAFDLEDNDTGFQWQFVTGTTTDPVAVQPADNPGFFAQTCDAPTQSANCGNGTLFTTPQNNGFKIFAQEDFYPVHGTTNLFQNYYLYRKHGVSTASGARWPTVAGVRNSSVYWYSCPMQPIVRDVVNYCSAPMFEDSYYRYPKYGSSPGWVVSRGNFGQNPGHDGLQTFAWDIETAQGTQIRATRGGRVVLLKESSTPFSNTTEGPLQSNICYERLKNCHLVANNGACTTDDDCTGFDRCRYGVCVSTADRIICQGSYPCDNGNYLYLRHQDGTYATYWHMDQNDVTPVEGQILQRSEEIGLVGDTGNSWANHLHFHVQTLNGIDTSSSVPVHFQAAQSEAPDNLCQVPPNGDTLPSSNDPGAFY